MKQFFVKKCIIKTRTKVNADRSISIIHSTEEMIEVEKLCMCMKNLTIFDILVGDRVWDDLSGYGIVTENTPEEGFLGVKYESQPFYVEEDFENIIKIIGPISNEAVWIKEGDEFDESEIKVQRICHDDSHAPYDSYCSHCCRSTKCDNDEGNEVLIKNPSCQHFH